MLQADTKEHFQSLLDLHHTPIDKIIHPNDLNDICSPYWEMLQDHEERTYLSEFRIRHAKGRWVWLQQRWIPFGRDAEQKINKILVISNDVSYIKNTELTTHHMLIRGQEKERQRIATDLHDAINPLLSVSKLNVESLRDSVAAGSRPPKEAIDNTIELLQRSMHSIREISANLHPSLIKDFGLLNALDDLCGKISKSNQIKIVFDHFGCQNRLDSNVELSLYRIAQELLNNIIKHANATKAELQLICREQDLVMMVTDNGQGFTTTLPQRGLGFKNIESRVKSLDGSLEIDSVVGRGTTVIITLHMDRSLMKS